MSPNQNKRNQSPRALFGEVSEMYERCRPSYPSNLIDDVILLSEIRADGRILEVGCGPGKATILFAQRGYGLVGVDCSEELLAIAQRRTEQFPNVMYKKGLFESTHFCPETLDTIICAQAWHWIDPKVGYQKAARLLKPSGALAIFWKYQDWGASDFLGEVETMLLKYNPSFPRSLSSTQKIEERLAGSKAFTPPAKKTYSVEIEYTPEEYCGLISTFSSVFSLPEKKRIRLQTELEALAKKQGERFCVPYFYNVVVAKKID